MITVKLCKRCAHSKFSICRYQSQLLKQQKSVLSVKKKNKVWCMSDLKGVLMLVPDPPSPPPLMLCLSGYTSTFLSHIYGDTPK